MANDRQLVPRGKFERNVQAAGGGFDFRKELARTQEITQKDFYSPKAGKRTPNSRLAAFIGIEDGISTEVIEYGKDKDKAWAKVLGWKGPRDNPEAITEEAVVHVFDLILLESIFDAIDNGIALDGSYEKTAIEYGEDYEIGADMRPVITNPKIQLQIMRNHLRVMKYGERDAITKAKRRVYLVLMGKRQGESRESQKLPPEDEETPKDPQTREECLSVLVPLLKECLVLSAGETPTSLLRSLCEESGIAVVSNTKELVKADHIKELISRTTQRIVKLQKEFHDDDIGEKEVREVFFHEPRDRAGSTSSDSGDKTIREGI